MQPQYFGPMIVVSCNKGGAYIICELDGILLHALVAAFQVVPYFAWTCIEILDIEQHIDVSVARLHKLEYSTTADPDDPDQDWITKVQDDEEDDSKGNHDKRET